METLPNPKQTNIIDTKLDRHDFVRIFNLKKVPKPICICPNAICAPKRYSYTNQHVVVFFQHFLQLALVDMLPPMVTTVIF